MVPNGCVTSSIVSRVTSKKETNKSASHLGHKMSKKCQTCVYVDGSLQKKKEKNNKSARTHPAYRQIWDTLLGVPYCCGVVLVFLVLAGNSFWYYVRTYCTIQLCGCVIFFVVAGKLILYKYLTVMIVSQKYQELSL